jgi:hypothetical protein
MKMELLLRLGIVKKLMIQIIKEELISIIKHSEKHKKKKKNKTIESKPRRPI